MSFLEILGRPTVEQLKDFGYINILDTNEFMIFKNKINLSKVLIKQKNGNYLLNFENNNNEKFLKSDWYLGNEDGVCCTDIFTIMEKPEFKKFCKCEQQEVIDDEDIDDEDKSLLEKTWHNLKQEIKTKTEENKNMPVGFENVRIHEGKLETTTQKQIKDICDSLSDLLVYKNQKYGNSALEPKNIFYKGNAETSILIRLDDKLGRIINNTDGIRVNDVCDIIGYLVLYLVLKNISKVDIEKLKD